MRGGKLKIVVTGGLGFIGRAFAAHMRKINSPHEIHSVDWGASVSAYDRALFDSCHDCCFSIERAKPAYANADVVLHLAATTTVQESIAKPEQSFLNNVVKTQRLLDHLRTTSPNAHFVFSSTGGAIIGNHQGAINERIAPRPVSPYGASKLAVEGLLSSYAGSFGMKATSLRFSNVYGPFSERKASIIATYCKAYLESRPLWMNGDGNQTRDFIYVDDVCRAIHRVIETEALGVFQLGTGIGTSICDVIKVFQAIDPRKQTTVLTRDELPGEVRHNVCDIQKAKDQLGFSPKVILADGIKRTLSWFQDEQLRQVA